ncbi:MAG: hypothetical protein GTO45_30505 [Candidatus Aminicenantes bacterium]|nr:hypothetical protein [Candidatus Aminicenantes bacterium]NIM83125.1 hypothetical protein [Candidatus Aminicenantes bacterium]NIN22504.1 hypothetical protein [Candidatus Aminicenantes bacterium]NIN46272.1 hypothetical protein [Candidatus Aminicenantes bacterium]NIN89110.1 hypothetical protein [Candidatus Aminicenantes bacterium]
MRLRKSISMVVAPLAFLFFITGCSNADKVQSLKKLSEETIGYSPDEKEQYIAKLSLKSVDSDDISTIARVFSYDRGGFIKMTKGLKNSSKFKIMLLYFLRFPVHRGLTDDDLLYTVYKGKRVKEISRIISSPAVSKCMSALNELAPKKLKGVIKMLAGVYYVGSNPHSVQNTTWAANSLARLNRDIMLVELVRGSTAAKLLVQEGDFDLPERTWANFRWSGRKSIEIPLPHPHLGADDVPYLKELIKSEYEYYRKAARKALEKMGESI